MANSSPPDFEQVFLPHLDAAYNLARWLLHNDHDAQDAVQDAYLRAYKAFPTFRGTEGKPWIMTIVRNVCLTMLKKSGAHAPPEPFDEAIHQAADDSAQREAFRQKANSETLHAALEKLPTESREIIVLHDLEGLPYKQIATLLSVPIGTVMSRLARARARLRAAVIASGQSQSSS